MNFVIHPREEIRLLEDSFGLYKGKEELFRVRWEDVREIVAFKRDLLISDCVYLAFRVEDDRSYFEVHEELSGFILLTDEMISRFPTIPSDWLGSVLQPPFATSTVRLFGQPLPAN